MWSDVQNSGVPKSLRISVTLAFGSIVAGALYLIAMRSASLGVDLSQNLSVMLWCF